MKGNNQKSDEEKAHYKQSNYNQQVHFESDEESDSKNSKNNTSDEHKKYTFINIHLILILPVIVSKI
jgi:hypothetical protein